MKSIFLAAFIALFLGACSKGYVIQSDLEKVISSSKIPSGVVRAFKKRTNENGLMEIELVLKSSDEVDIEYRIEWLDADGFVLKNPIDEDYKAITLLEEKEYILRKLASDKRAQDFRIEIRED